MTHCDFCKKEVTPEENRCPECGCTLHDDSVTESTPLWQLEVLKLLKQKQKIAAIKIHRENTGSGLAEGRDAIEKMAVDYGLDTPEYGMGASPKTGCAGMLVFLILLTTGLFVSFSI